MTVNVCPATVNVPVRDEVVELAWMLNAVVPLPLPLPPEVTVMNDELLTPVHVQPLVVVIVADPALLPAATDWLVGVTLYEHVPAD